MKSTHKKPVLPVKDHDKTVPQGHPQTSGDSKFDEAIDLMLRPRPKAAQSK